MGFFGIKCGASKVKPAMKNLFKVRSIYTIIISGAKFAKSLKDDYFRAEITNEGE